MEQATTSPRYTKVAIALHWITALLIVFNFIAVWTAEDASDAVKGQLMAAHMAVGLTILVLSVLRIVWRLTHRAPPFDPSLRPWEVALAKLVHGIFYFLIIAIPFTGWAMVSAFGSKGVAYFGVFDFPPLPFGPDKATAGVFHEVHELLAMLMLVLFVIHTLAALKHMFFDRDSTMARMIPWLR